MSTHRFMTEAEAEPINAINFALHLNRTGEGDGMVFLTMWNEGDLSESDDYIAWVAAQA